MKFTAGVTLAILLVIATALFLSSLGLARLVTADGYSHGATSCLQGVDGSGIRLQLRERRRCGGESSYPYLEIHIRELPITLNESIVIGVANPAFRCEGPKRSCEQFRSGELMFNHFEEIRGKELLTDGWYELRIDAGVPQRADASKWIVMNPVARIGCSQRVRLSSVQKLLFG